MSKLIISALAAALLWIPCEAAAQSRATINPDDFYQSQIKLVDEFINRFNGKKMVADDSLSDHDLRLMNLLRLFDTEWLKSPGSPQMKLAREMCQTAIDSAVRLNYEDSLWRAEVECNAKLAGKPVNITVGLRIAEVEPDTYTWVIDSAAGDALTLAPSKRDVTISLMPDDHETDFLALRRVTKENDDYVLNYAAPGYAPDALSVFFTFVYNGLLEIESVGSSRFIFDQIPGYSFTVSYINRPGDNGGWLVTAINPSR